MTESALPTILALDLARQMGWAMGRIGEIPRCGTKELAPAGAGNGTVGRGLLRWMNDFLKLETPDIVYIEAPLDPRHMGKKTNFLTARQLIGLAFTAETIAETRGIYRVREATVQDAREVFVGQRRPPNGKADVQKRCRELGWRFPDDNAADAACLWAFACRVEKPGILLARGEPAPELIPRFRPRHADIPEIPA